MSVSEESKVSVANNEFKKLQDLLKLHERVVTSSAVFHMDEGPVIVVGLLPGIEAELFEKIKGDVQAMCLKTPCSVSEQSPGQFHQE
ncbi:MAG TPA: hypothetical protein VLA04_05775 [Verrucomicrobiae bacterium]|nr:hypothetical protein [Verrucomicrobiae bacterium]